MPKASPKTADEPPPDLLEQGSDQAASSGKVDRAQDRDIVFLEPFGANMDESEEFLKILWWGREGSAKTTDIATAANRGRILVVNAEGGFKKKPLRELGVDLSNIVLWPDPKSGVEISQLTLDELYWRVKAQLMAEPGYFYAVGWDSVSDIYTRFVSDVRRAEHEKNKTARVKKEHREDPFFTDRSDYGTATTQLQEALRRWRDLPCHFLVSALERRDIDPDTSKVAYGPGVGPAFQKDLLGYLDVTVATKASTLQTGPDDEIDVIDSFRGLTRSNGRQRAKDRLKSLPRVMALPTFERILDYVEDRIDEESDPVQKEWLEAKLEDERWTGGGAPAPAPAASPSSQEVTTPAAEGAETDTGPVDE